MSHTLKCPVCGQPLTKSTDGKKFTCVSSHSFDLAKEGYLNLLLNAKPTAGDAKEMMQARRHFLEAGYYQPLSDAVNQAILSAVTENATANPTLVDVGCGEGYYLGRASQILPESTQAYGLDISKVGIKMAAKKYKKIDWLVANFAHLPFMNQSVDLILSMFAEYSVDEFQRILAENGQIILVRAGKNHLIELKNIIYPELHEKARAASIKPFPGFSVEQKTVEFQAHISNSDDLMSLLLMTPHYWKIRPDGVERLRQQSSLTVTCQMELEILKRQSI